ncbi:hypothetical protein LE190_17325 [Massilia oculi]|uniref:Uncharacterized protein n=1 Tax=Massilia hydrophila TaxID=3044279 RepID=A0ABS7YHF7_9BURK|nr:hypothetical protein [Massilia oculi]MCA1857679.1 hypothetical protein [Massilia oculi]
MDKLIAALTRLYLMPQAATPEALAQHFQGVHPLAVPLASDEGDTRAIVIDFPPRRDVGPGQHWTDLCAVANRLQEAFGFPAPSVSISGASSFRLWLSLAESVPVGDARRLTALLRENHFPDLALQALDAVELPPFLNPASGKWAAFIHPGMGAAFTEEAGLDIRPPAAAQLAFLEGLDSIGKTAFFDALAAMKQADAAPAAVQPAPALATGDAGLLLKDATLEDIVRHLHARGIEPSFRHVLPRGDRERTA